MLKGGLGYSRSEVIAKGERESVAASPEGAGPGGRAGEEAGGFRAVLVMDGETADGDFMLLRQLVLLFAGARPGGGEPAGIFL